MAVPSVAKKVMQVSSGTPVFCNVNFNTPEDSDPVALSSLKQ